VVVEYGPGGYSHGHTHAKSAFIYATVIEGAIRSRVVFMTTPGVGNDRLGCAPLQGGDFQWVQAPPSDSLQPEAIGAVMEVTKWLKPSISGHNW
jgi:hypothetical protein